MKKSIVVLLISLASIVFADIITDLQNIDKDLQNKDYNGALSKSKEAMKKAISDDDKKAIEAVVNEIKEKIKDTSADVLNNLGASDVEVQENDELTTKDSGTLPGLPAEHVADAAKFEKYKKYEQQVVSTGNSEAIHSLAMLYIKEGLYEHAMNLALRDRSRNIKNIYLAATTARMIGKYDQAIKLYNNILNVNSSHAKTYLGLAMAYKGKGKFSQSLKYLKMYANYDNSRRIQEDIHVLSSI